MKQNVEKIDKIVRVVAGLVLLSLLFILEGDARWIGLIGLVPLVGMNTCCATKDGEKVCCGGGSCHGDKKDAA